MRRPPDKPDLALAAVVRHLRLDLGLTQEELAFEADLTISAMARIERGKSTPAWTTVKRIAVALGVTVHDLARAAEGGEAG